MAEKTFYTYLLLTESNTYYCGYTDDIKKRYRKHLNGLGAKYTKANRPMSIAYLESFATKSEAMKEECRIKKLSHLEKEKLVNNFSKKLSKMYRFAKEVSSSC